ncbi:MAG: hypothetical protein V2I67_15920 [Thermoanaerobaculales bacterium]|nr:hypothetical protein [Thermoanaerobaculales bacterium]
MRESRGLLILLAVVVLAAGLVWYLTRPEPPEPVAAMSEPDAPLRFSFSEMTVRSPDLQLTDVRVGGSTSSDGTSWVVTATCAEPAGCVGEILAEVSFRSDGGRDAVRFSGEFDVGPAEVLRFDGFQSGRRAVDGVDRVAVSVVDREITDYSSGEVEL